MRITLHRTSCYPSDPAVRITQRRKKLIINANRREEREKREREERRRRRRREREREREREKKKKSDGQNEQGALSESFLESDHEHRRHENESSWTHANMHESEDLVSSLFLHEQKSSVFLLEEKKHRHEGMKETN